MTDSGSWVKEGWGVDAGGAEELSWVEDKKKNVRFICAHTAQH